MSTVDRQELHRALHDPTSLLEQGFAQVNARLDAINGRLRRNEEKVAEHSATLRDYGQIRETALRADTRLTDLREQRRQGAVTGARVGGAVTAAAAIVIEVVRRLWGG